MFLHQVFKDMYNSFLIIFVGLVVVFGSPTFFQNLKKKA